MDIVTLAKYPFLQESSKYVKEGGYSLDSIVNGALYERVRVRGKSRVIRAIEGIAKGDMSFDDVELLSYAVAKMYITVIKDNYLTKRYALMESKRAYEMLKDEKENVILMVGEDLGITTRVKDRDFVLHFTDYLKHASSLRSLEWKLINRKMIDGMVYIDKEDYVRLLEEAIRKKIEASLHIQAPEGLEKALSQYIVDIRLALDKLKSERNISVEGEVSKDEFPPCMKYHLSELQKGVNLPHTARFALTSFLANIGLSKEEIMELYRMAPDFREDLTRYQVEHITGSSGTEYTAPSCKTMLTYGNCYGKNKMCEWVTHPLNYYRKALAMKKKATQGLKAPAPVPMVEEKKNK
jgi:DNA primase large subunit